MKFSDLRDAYDFVSGAEPCEHEAFVSRSSGKTYVRSELAGVDELPEGSEDDGDLVAIPHKHDLDLGQPLVWRFVDEVMPAQRDAARGIFARRGAYGRFKDLLERGGLLQRWYDFEEEETDKALREWCQENAIPIEEQP